MELIHTCYRISEIERSVAFYTALGFEERARMPIREEAVNVFMGLPGHGDQLELTYNFGVDSYELGTGYGHIALAVDDLEATLARLAGLGIEPERPPYRVPRRLASLSPRPGRLPRRADRSQQEVARSIRSCACRDDGVNDAILGGAFYCQTSGRPPVGRLRRDRAPPPRARLDLPFARP